MLQSTEPICCENCASELNQPFRMVDHGLVIDVYNLKSKFYWYEGLVCDSCHDSMHYKSDEIRFVNVYTVTRHYGGAEEGGWYYNWFECQEVIPVQHQYAQDLADEFLKRYVTNGYMYGDIYSVLGGQDVEVYVEDHPKQSETKERPFYE